MKTLNKYAGLEVHKDTTERGMAHGAFPRAPIVDSGVEHAAGVWHACLPLAAFHAT